MADIVRTALDTLDKREKLVVQEYLMSDDEDKRSLAEIGRQLGVSRERARQLESRAKKKLRQRILEISNVRLHSSPITGVGTRTQSAI
jgi:RNA polymerase sigma-32 factor